MKNKRRIIEPYVEESACLMHDIEITGVKAIILDDVIKVTGRISLVSPKTVDICVVLEHEDKSIIAASAASTLTSGPVGFFDREINLDYISRFAEPDDIARIILMPIEE